MGRLKKILITTLSLFLITFMYGGFDIKAENNVIEIPIKINDLVNEKTEIEVTNLSTNESFHHEIKTNVEEKIQLSIDETSFEKQSFKIQQKSSEDELVIYDNKEFVIEATNYIDENNEFSTVVFVYKENSTKKETKIELNNTKKEVKKGIIKVLKVNEENKALKGAKLAIISLENGERIEWLSEDKTSEIELYFSKYKVSEIEAPNGYETIEDFVIEIDKDYNIHLVEDVTFAKISDNILIIEDPKKEEPLITPTPSPSETPKITPTPTPSENPVITPTPTPTSDKPVINTANNNTIVWYAFAMVLVIAGAYISINNRPKK